MTNTSDEYHYSLFCDQLQSSSSSTSEKFIEKEILDSTHSSSTSLSSWQQPINSSNKIETNNNANNSKKTRWNRTNNCGGTVLSDPIFQKHFQIDVEYRQLSKEAKRRKPIQQQLSLPSFSEMDSFDLFNPVVSGDDKNNNKDQLQQNDETRRLVDSNNSLLLDENSLLDPSEDKFDRNDNSICNWNLYKGIFYSSLSSVFFSLSAVIVKYLKDIHPGQLAVCRFFGIFVLTIPMIVYYDLNPFGPSELRPILIMRGIAGATSLFLRFISFHYLPIADASVIIFSVPVFVSIFAWIYLKEPCGLFHTFTIIIAMIGLIMTTKLPTLFGSDSSMMHPNNYYLYNQAPMNISAYKYYQNLTSTWMNQSISPQTQRINHLYGVIAALSSLIFSSSVFIFIRKARCAHHAVIMFNFGWVAILETTIITSILNGFSMPRTPFEWYLIVVLSVFSFCGQILLTRSLQLEQAGPVSVVRATTDIALAFVWQLIIFKDVPDMWSICGALVVSSCIVLTALHKWVLSLPEHSILKEKLNFLLI